MKKAFHNKRKPSTKTRDLVIEHLNNELEKSAVFLIEVASELAMIAIINDGDQDFQNLANEVRKEAENLRRARVFDFSERGEQ